jgi:hypothetical protein
MEAYPRKLHAFALQKTAVSKGSLVWCDFVLLPVLLAAQNFRF